MWKFDAENIVMAWKRTSLVVVISSIAIISGCSQKITRVLVSSHIASEQRFERNYELGQKMTAYVGQPVIKVKDYKVDRFMKNAMRATVDYTISGGGVTFAGYKDEDLEVEGETVINGTTYTVLNSPWSKSGGHADLLIKPDGTVHNKILTAASQSSKHGAPVFAYDAHPDDLRFERVEEEQINVSSGYVNYELIYGGTDGESIKITYREYTSEDMARSAFFQDLVYEKGQSQIRFRDTVLAVHEATNQEIVYTVISDGR